MHEDMQKEKVDCIKSLIKELTKEQKESLISYLHSVIHIK